MPQLAGAASGAISFAPLAEIAVGATARIDLCRTSDGRLLAVKRLHAHIAEDPGFAAQFFDEAWMTAALKHANVVEVAGWGTDAEGSYLACELVQGVSLARLMKTVFDTGEVFTERMVVFVCSKICAGLAAAHALKTPQGEHLQLVHRDLTPGNILIGFNGQVKVADFGLAKAKMRLTKTLTGLLKGQPTYMAPEQAKNQEIDARADLFALGVLMFELFAGRRPWVANSDYEMMQRTINEPPADLRELRPKIDKELVAIVNRCLEKDPAKRFQTARDVGQRLDHWLSVHGYTEGGEEAVGRFVRRNAMRQMRWFEKYVGPTPSATTTARPPASSTAVTRATTQTTAPGKKSARVPQARAPSPDDDEEEEDPTEITARKAGDFLGPPRVSEPEEGEEIPTLVQKEHPAIKALKKAKPRTDPLADLPSLVDEESDQRETAVKKAVKISVEAARVHRQESTIAGPRPGRAGLPAIGDRESEEVPTRPRSGPKSVAPPPVSATAPAGAIPRPAAVRSVPPPPVEDYGANGGPGGRESAGTGAGVRVATPVPDRANGSGALSLENLKAEADRLAIESVRRTEEAKVAALRAERRAHQAKLAIEAAHVAAEAVRLAGSNGLPTAAAKLEEAYEIERAMIAGQMETGAHRPATAQLPAASVAAPLPPSAAAPPAPAPDALVLAPAAPTHFLGLSPVAVAALATAAFAVALLVLYLVFG